MAGAVWLPWRMSRCSEALAEVVAAAALVDQAEIPRTDGQLTFSFALQESDQLRDEFREDGADEGVVLLHARRVAVTRPAGACGRSSAAVQGINKAPEPTG